MNLKLMKLPKEHKMKYEACLAYSISSRGTIENLREMCAVQV